MSNIVTTLSKVPIGGEFYFKGSQARYVRLEIGDANFVAYVSNNKKDNNRIHVTIVKPDHITYNALVSLSKKTT